MTPDDWWETTTTSTRSTGQRLREAAVDRQAGILAVIAAILVTVAVWDVPSRVVPGLAALVVAPVGPAHRPPAGIGETGTPRASVPFPTGSAYTPWRTTSTGEPVRWSPCRTWSYVVDTTGQPPGGDVVLASAVARLDALTGLDFALDPSRDPDGDAMTRALYVPGSAPDDWNPVLVRWQSGDDIDRTTGPVVAHGDAGPGFVTGTVVLDASAVREAFRWRGLDDARDVALGSWLRLIGLRSADPPHPGPLPPPQSPADRDALRSMGSGACRPDL